MKTSKREIEVLRLSERTYRDLRITTHVALVARAFGANKVYLAEGTNPEIKRTIDKVTKRFGGIFEVEYAAKPIEVIKTHKKNGFAVVHLTMYGEKLSKAAPALRKEKKILIVVGADKVPPEIYQLADFNISVTNQPHSEVAALGVALHEIMEGKEETMSFQNAKLQVIPSERGKKMTKEPNTAPLKIS